MSNKDKCKVVMTEFFGPATGAKVDTMTEEECLSKCRTIVKSFLGEAKAAEFDKRISA